jgi:sugar lactone lactonase YvrE
MHQKCSETLVGVSLYAVDGGRVQVFNSSGTYQSQFLTTQYYSNASGSIGVAVDALGNIYVSNTGLISLVQEFDSSGVYKRQVGLGQLINPAGVAVDSSGNIYVADTNNSRIVKYGSCP